MAEALGKRRRKSGPGERGLERPCSFWGPAGPAQLPGYGAMGYATDREARMKAWHPTPSSSNILGCLRRGAGVYSLQV